MAEINNFDDYCRAFTSGGELRENARLIHFLRSWLIAVQNLDKGRDEEKLGYIGLTEILKMSAPAPCDELSRISAATFDSVRHISNSFREKILRENVMMPTYRAKEISEAGLNWLSRKSGRTIREKLSSTNSLLAVRRRMSLDTGENRLFMAFIRRMEEYIEQKRKSCPELLTLCERDLQENILKILHREEIEEIRRTENTQPNNTLLSDKFYRQIWRGQTDLQNISELIHNDSKKISERLCTVYFWKLLTAAASYCKFSQQPIFYDYANFELKPLRGNKIYGLFDGKILSIKNLGTHLEFEYSGERYEVSFSDTVAKLKRDNEELQQKNITVDNFNEFVKQAIDCIFYDVKKKPNFEKQKIFSNSPKLFIDIFSVYPLYLAENNKVRKFKNRIVRQEFFQDKNRLDLSAEFSTSLIISDDDSAQLYSINSCLECKKSSADYFNNLVRMIHKKNSAGGRVEEIFCPCPDIYNEFQLSPLRRALKIYYNKINTMPRSVAVMFYEMRGGNCEKFRDGDFALVVDYVNGKATLTLIQARFNEDIKNILPETSGFTWERQPTYSVLCIPDDFENFEDKLNDLLCKSGLNSTKENVDKLLKVFSTKYLSLEDEKLAVEFSNSQDEVTAENWINLTAEMTKILNDAHFQVTEIVNKYLKRMANIISDKKVFIYNISPQLNFLGANATFRPFENIPLIGMNFCEELSKRLEDFQRNCKKILPPLWTDRLPELAIKRLFGVFELIKESDANKVQPQFGITQKISIPRRFTLTKNKIEYRFGLILGDSKEISYEAVINHRAFPLVEDVECELDLTYTYGQDIPYKLIFKPVNSSIFREAEVIWEEAKEYPFQNLNSPEFPADKENWQTLRNIETRKGKKTDALDWIENTFKPRVIIDFDKVNYTVQNNGYIYVKTFVNGTPTILYMYYKDSEIKIQDKKVIGVYSMAVDLDRAKRYTTTFNSGDWQTIRSGAVVCFRKYIDEENPQVTFFESNLLFGKRAIDTIGRRVTFSIYTDKAGRQGATGIIVEDTNYQYLYAFNVTSGDSVYELNNLSVVFPLHKVYSNGRSSNTPGCPEDFKKCVEEMKKILPNELVKSWNAGDMEHSSKILRIMSIMAADIGKPIYDMLKVVLENKPEILTDDLGCALGDYDRTEQQELFMQIISSKKIKDTAKIYILNKAAWKSDKFILNVPTNFLLQYFDKAVNEIRNHANKRPQDVLKCLEYVLAIFRLRQKNDDFLNKFLSLNNKKIRRLYNALEDMIEKNYSIPKSRIELEVTKSNEYAKYNISSFYYAMLVYITGGEDEIKISGISENEDD